jgi:hypothetical protein
MIKVRVTALVFSAIILAAAISYPAKRNGLSQKTERGFGAISGFVIDENGHPVALANVYSMPSSQPTNGRVMSVQTDKDGKFLLQSVPPGLNTVHAYKEDDGYPDTFFAFYVTDRRAIPQVTVYQQQVANVVVQLGPKAGKMVIQVFDVDTNERIDNAAVELKRPGDPNAYVSLSCIPSETSGSCEILVPPLPTNIKASKSGYAEQDLTGQLGSQTGVATLTPGETKHLTIHLRRIRK